jgi:hypothetical protein
MDPWVSVSLRKQSPGLDGERHFLSEEDFLPAEEAMELRGTFPQPPAFTIR